MELQKEIDLLKEKVVLLERLNELQDMAKQNVVEKEIIYVPVYPSYPTPYPVWPLITCDTTVDNIPRRR